MELKRYIETTAELILPSIDHLQLVEYKDKELDFAYGMQEYRTSVKGIFNQFKRKLLR
jgi:molecular chaperone GrpE (heat shock protein)